MKAIIAKQTKINNRVAEGQQGQIDALKTTIKEKDRLLNESNRVKAVLETRLTQSEKMVTELRQERLGLIEERDQMKALRKELMTEIQYHSGQETHYRAERMRKALQEQGEENE